MVTIAPTQVLQNLVGNALKFTHAGRVCLSVAPCVEDAAAAVIIKVSDTGIGIPQDKLSQIWRPFDQVRISNPSLRLLRSCK
jgi:signal transduction histidine kinase